MICIKGDIYKVGWKFSEKTCWKNLYKKRLFSCIYIFLSLKSLNFTTYHYFLHDCPLIKLTFFSSSVSLIVMFIHSFTIFINNSLLLMLYTKYNMTWRVVVISLNLILIRDEPIDVQRYEHCRLVSIVKSIIHAWRLIFIRDDRLTLKRWTLQTSVHCHLLNRSCLETDPCQGYSSFVCNVI